MNHKFAMSCLLLLLLSPTSLIVRSEVSGIPSSAPARVPLLNISGRKRYRARTESGKPLAFTWKLRDAPSSNSSRWVKRAELRASLSWALEQWRRSAPPPGHSDWLSKELLPDTTEVAPYGVIVVQFVDQKALKNPRFKRLASDSLPDVPACFVPVDSSLGSGAFVGGVVYLAVATHADAPDGGQQFFASIRKHGDSRPSAPPMPPERNAPSGVSVYPPSDTEGFYCLNMILLHEVGHVLGLGHSDNPDVTMASRSKTGFAQQDHDFPLGVELRSLPRDR